MNEASQARYGRIQAEHMRSPLLLVVLKWNRTLGVNVGIQRLGSGGRGSLLRSSFLALLLILCAQIFTHSHASAQTDAVQPRSENIFPGKSWHTVASLEKAGWSEGKLAAAHAYADSIHSSAVMIVQGGQIVYEWGNIHAKIVSYSVRKSFISSLYGIYSAEGAIDTNETLEHLGIDETHDRLTPAEKQARVVDLLRARSGVYHDVDFETSYMKAHRPARGSHAPGTFWYYNNWDYNVLGTIFERKTGLRIGDAFYGRIAQRWAWRIFSRLTSFTSAARFPTIRLTTSKVARAIWPASVCSTCATGAGTASRSFPKPGWRKARTALRW